jgi:hypothetical protein
MKFSKEALSFLLLLLAEESNYTAAINIKRHSHLNSRKLQSCPAGYSFNTCANCCGYKFANKTALQAAVDGYPANQATYGGMKCWDVSSVTSMWLLFQYSQLNEPIGCWDMSNVISTGYMFYNAVKFNQAIGNWNFSKLTDM